MTYRSCLRIGLWALLVSGCAPAPPPLVLPSPPPEPLPEAAISAIARLLEAEDRRAQDFASVRSPAVAEFPEVRARAVLAAGRSPDPRAADLVRALLDDPDTLVRATAAFVSGQLRDTAAVGSLVALLGLSSAALDPTPASEAAGALGKIGGPDALHALGAFLQGADTLDALLGPVAREVLIGSWRAGETSVQPFLPWVRHADPQVRWRAVYALSRRPRPEAVVPLSSLLDDSDPGVRSMAVRGLAAPVVAAAGISSDRVLPGIVRAIEDSSYAVRIEAVRVLGTYREPESRRILRGVALSGTSHEAIAAIESLGRSSPPVDPADTDALARLIRDSGAHPFLRESAIDAMVAVDRLALFPHLPELAVDPSWRVRGAAARALSRRGPDGLPLLVTLARDRDPRVAAVAIEEAIRSVGPTDITRIQSLLFEALQNPDPMVRTAALRGFSILSDPVVYPALLDAFERSYEDREHDAAIAALDAIADLAHSGLVAPERALFARFSRPANHHVRQKAVSRFGDLALAAWGEPLPVETRYSAPEYRAIVAQWIAPPPTDRSRPRVEIQTEVGTIEVVLFADAAPMTVANFLELAESGFYDGQEWPRVVPNFVVQGGDPRGDTSGGPGYTIRDELNRVRFEAGTLGMALSGPDTGGSQFFITLSPQPHLDGAYTAFGRVLNGSDVLERILPGSRIVAVRALPEGE